MPVVHFWLSENWTGSTFDRAKTGPGPLLAERKLDGSTFGGAKARPDSLLVDKN